MSSRFLVTVFVLGGLCLAWPQTTPLTADQIMESVAANQDRAEALRREYVYKQHIHVASRKTNGKLMREENADYDVFPTEQSFSKKLKLLQGRFWDKNEYRVYTGEQASDDDSMDGEIVSDFRNDLINENKTSKDGFAAHLFPLTSKEQRQYRFKLFPDQTMNGRSVYRVGFTPRDNSDVAWSGEAFIDQQDLEPVMIFTKLAKKLPFMVRTALGTDLPGAGFSVTYKRQPDGVWFPATFGTEFRLKALFFINRDISVSLQNTEFERTHVDSTIHYSAMQ